MKLDRRFPLFMHVYAKLGKLSREIKHWDDIKVVLPLISGTLDASSQADVTLVRQPYPRGTSTSQTHSSSPLQDVRLNKSNAYELV